MRCTTARLGDVVTFSGGGTPNRSNPAYFGGDVPWVTPKDMKAWEIRSSEISLTQAGVQNSTTRLVDAGSVLIVVRSGVLKHSLPVAINRVPVAINQDIKALCCSKVLRSDYLARYLQATAKQILASVRATTADNIPTAVLQDLQVPLPPLEEQKRIAAILDAAEALREKRRRAIECVDSLTAAVFRSLFGDQNRVAGATTQLGDVAEFYAGATLPEGTRYIGQEGGCLLAKVSDLNLRGNEVHLHRSAGWLNGFGPTASTCPAGGVIIPKRGGAISTNKKRLSTRPTVLDPNLMGIVGRAGRIIPEFLYQWFLLFDLASITSGSSVPQLNKKDLQPLDIALPPLADQERFAKFWGRNEQLRTRMEGALATAERACSALQHRAFRGEL